MNERFYLVKIAYNKEKQAEDRVITGYNSQDEAEKAYHSYMTQNILGKTIGWCYACVINGYGVKLPGCEKRWDATVEAE